MFIKTVLAELLSPNFPRKFSIPANTPLFKTSLFRWNIHHLVKIVQLLLEYNVYQRRTKGSQVNPRPGQNNVIVK